MARMEQIYDALSPLERRIFCVCDHSIIQLTRCWHLARCNRVSPSIHIFASPLCNIYNEIVQNAQQMAIQHLFNYLP